MQRIAVAGVAGVGKSTLCRALGAALDLPYSEIDALYHGPGWVPRESFLADVDALTLRDRWVIEWQYRPARELIAARADTLVWLDLPLPVQQYRLLRRTISRSRSGRELWNGNTEAPLRTVLTDQDHILRWGWRTRNKYRDLVPPLAESHPRLSVVRLRRPSEVDRWLRTVTS